MYHNHVTIDGVPLCQCRMAATDIYKVEANGKLVTCGHATLAGAEFLAKHLRDAGYEALAVPEACPTIRSRQSTT